MTEIISLSTKSKVPDYLNDTNIYCRYGSNKVVEVTPKEVCFAGFKLNERNVKEVRFVNISDEISRFHIIPPVSNYFKLMYDKPVRLVPGFYVKCKVIFTPDKPRIYNDFIKIHTKDSDNHLIVPIYAYPAIDGLKVPRNIKFPVTPVGKICSKMLILHSDTDYNFQFDIKVIKDNPFISIEPLSGEIPANGNLSIKLQFAPKQYVTCEKTISINVVQYNFQPITCTISGSSEPGLDKKIFLGKCTGDELVSINKLEAKRKNMKSKLSMAYSMGYKTKNSQEIVEYKDEFKFLKNQFENRVRDCVAGEKQNQLKWQTRIGHKPMTENEIYVLLQHRKAAMSEYQLRIRNPAELEDVYKEGQVDTTNWFRTYRTDEDKVPDIANISTAQFVPECWVLRKMHLERFREAASRIIIYGRWIKRMKSLLKTGGFFLEIETSHTNPGDVDDENQLTFYRPLQTVDDSRVIHDEPTIYSNENWQMSEYITMSTIPLTSKYNFWNLDAPLQLKVQGYERIDTSLLSYPNTYTGHELRLPAVADKSVVEDDQSLSEPINYVTNSELNYTLHQDKDQSMIVIETVMQYCDRYSNLPLYYYQQEVTTETNVSHENKELLLEEQLPKDLEWSISKSTFLKSRRLLKSSINDRGALESLDSVILDSEIPSMMSKKNMEGLDYISESADNSDDGVINQQLLLETFPIIGTLRDEIIDDWNK